MPARVILVPYKNGSQSVRALKESILAAKIPCFRRPIDSPKRLLPSDLVVYYGGTQQLYAGRYYTLNANRSIAQNKLVAFRAFQAAGLSTVEWTPDYKTAFKWWDEDKQTVIERQTLTGHSGQGIVVYDQNSDQFENVGSRLFTKYMKKTYECRVHVFNNKVIDAQIKRKKTTETTDDKPNPTIRNIHTGWVYCRENFVLPEQAKELAIAAVQAVGLDFGAVDLIYNQHHKQFYLLEVNTAPGLEGTTLQNYTKEIVNVCQTN